MKAAVCREFGAALTIEDVDIAPPMRGQIAIKTSACAICHSDIAYAQGKWGGELPAVYGHEASGIVTAVGEGVEQFKRGDGVLATLIYACGACVACSAGHPTSCESAYEALPSPLSIAGKSVVQGMKTGAFAEAMVVYEGQCVRLPDDIDTTVASLLACGVITGIGAVTNSAKLQPGQTAAVIGAGGVGLNTIQGCALSDAKQTLAIDLNEEKLAAAREFGATDTIISSPNLIDDVRALTGGRGVDFVFVTVGAPKAFEGAPELLAPGGSVILVGLTASEDMVQYKPTNLAAMNQSLVGSRMGQTILDRDIPHLLDLYRKGRLKLDQLITGTYKLEEINDAIEATMTGTARRNVIVFDH